MNIPMGSYEHSYGFLCAFQWVPMKIPMGSYEHSYGFLRTFLWVPMDIPTGSYYTVAKGPSTAYKYENSNGFL